MPVSAMAPQFYDISMTSRSSEQLRHPTGAQRNLLSALMGYSGLSYQLGRAPAPSRWGALPEQAAGPAPFGEVRVAGCWV